MEPVTLTRYIYSLSGTTRIPGWQVITRVTTRKDRLTFRLEIFDSVLDAWTSVGRYSTQVPANTPDSVRDELALKIVNDYESGGLDDDAMQNISLLWLVQDTTGIDPWNLGDGLLVDEE
jgi:hypothetical protein